MHRRGLDQPHIAINSAAGIPARGIGRIVQPDGQFVLAAELHIRRQVHAPGRITIRPAADESGHSARPSRKTSRRPHPGKSILPASSAGIFNFFRYQPTPAARQPAHAAAAGVGERPFDGPIVRQIDLAATSCHQNPAAHTRRRRRDFPSGRTNLRDGSLMKSLPVGRIHCLMTAVAIGCFVRRRRFV